MAVPFARLLLPTLPACQPQVPPRLSFSRLRVSPLLGHVSFVGPTTTCDPGNRTAAFAASASVAAAPAPEAEVGEPVGPRTRLVAQNIPWDYTADDMRALFEKHGAVINVEGTSGGKINIGADRRLNFTSRNLSFSYDRIVLPKNRGLVFVTMGSEEEALVALNSLNSTILNERTIRVDFARPRKKQRKQPVAASDPTPKYILFVGNLTWRVRSLHLRELFASTPGFLSAEVIFHTTTPRRSAGYAFVSFSSQKAAEAAISAFNGQKLMGQPINVMFKGDSAKKNKSSVPTEEPGVELSEQSDS